MILPPSQWAALGPDLQALQHALYLSRGASVFRVSQILRVPSRSQSREGSNKPSSSLSVGGSAQPQTLADAASIAVQRAGHLRRVLLALPQPEPLPRLVDVFANPRALKSTMGSNAMMEDRLAAALSRGFGSVCRAEASDRTTERIVELLHSSGSTRYVPRPSTTETITYNVPALEAALSLDDCRCVLPAVRDALHKSFLESGRRHLTYAHRFRIVARDLFLACERGDYTRASLMVGGKFALRKTSLSSVSSMPSGSQALSSIDAIKASVVASHDKQAIGALVENERSQLHVVDAPSAASVLGLGALQVRSACVPCVPPF